MSVFIVGKDGGMTVGETLIIIDPMEGLLIQVCSRKAWLPKKAGEMGQAARSGDLFFC